MQGWVLFDKFTFLSNKHKWERQGCVCVVLKIAGFKSQCKPRAFFCRKTLPPGFKAYHLQRDFASTPPQWGVRMATWTRFPILYTPPQNFIPFSQYLITSFSPENVLIQKTIPSCPSLGFFSHRLTASFSKSLVTV